MPSAANSRASASPTRTRPTSAWEPRPLHVDVAGQRDYRVPQSGLDRSCESCALGDRCGEAEDAVCRAQQIPARRVVDDAARVAAAEDHCPQEPARHLVQPARDGDVLRRLARLTPLLGLDVRLTLLGLDFLPDLN